MNKLKKLIGESQAIFAFALCLLTCGFLAPSTWAKPATEPILARPTVVVNADAAVLTNGVLSAETAAGSGLWHAWSNQTATVVYTAKKGYYFEDGTSEKTVKLETSVNPAVTKSGEVVPAAPAAPTVQLGEVAQRYPWEGVLDVECMVSNMPKDQCDVKLTVEIGGVKKGEVYHNVTTGVNKFEFPISTHFPETKGEAKVSAELTEKQPPM